jgi:hypothetical protein
MLVFFKAQILKSPLYCVFFQAQILKSILWIYIENIQGYWHLVLPSTIKSPLYSDYIESILGHCVYIPSRRTKGWWHAHHRGGFVALTFDSEFTCQKARDQSIVENRGAQRGYPPLNEWTVLTGGWISYIQVCVCVCVCVYIYIYIYCIYIYRGRADWWDVCSPGIWWRSGRDIPHISVLLMCF